MTITKIIGGGTMLMDRLKGKTVKVFLPVTDSRVFYIGIFQDYDGGFMILKRDEMDVYINLSVIISIEVRK